jgi:fatty acid desaturase
MCMSQPESGRGDRGDTVRKPWHSLVAASLAFLLLVLSLAGLYVLSLGALGPVIAIAGIVILIVAFHYFVWGWWLGPAIRREQELEDERSKDSRDEKQ